MREGLKTDYMKVEWVELITTPVHGKKGRVLEEIKSAALRRAMDGQPGSPHREEANLLAGRIEAEQSRRSNRTMLWIAFVGLMVTGAAALADLVPKLIDWISKLVNLCGL